MDKGQTYSCLSVKDFSKISEKGVVHLEGGVPLNVEACSWKQMILLVFQLLFSNFRFMEIFHACDKSSNINSTFFFLVSIKSYRSLYSSFAFLKWLFSLHIIAFKLNRMKIITLKSGRYDFTSSW